jgi:hypothetical protein
MQFAVKFIKTIALLQLSKIDVAAYHSGSSGPHSPPQEATKATGDKKVLIVRVDFPDAMSSGTAWLDDSTAASWLGGSSDASTQFNAYIKKASLGRLLFDQQTVVTGLVRMPAAITSYTTSYELYEGLRSIHNFPYDPSSFDLVMMFWENSADHFEYAAEGYPGTPMVLSINGMVKIGGRSCTQCTFGILIHEISHCLGADYDADAWLPYPVAPANLSSRGAPRCTGISFSDPISGCAVAQGDPYDPLGWPSQSSSSQPQAKTKWQYGWIRETEVHIAENSRSGYGERVRLIAHDLGLKSLPSEGSSARLALVAESEVQRQGPRPPHQDHSSPWSHNTVGLDWLWVEYKAGYSNVFDKETWSASQQQLLRQRGAILHLASGPGVGHHLLGDDVETPVLLDANPLTTQGTTGDWPKGLADAPLQVGRSLRVTGHGLVVTVLGRSCNEDPPWLEVVVHHGSEESLDADTAPTVIGIQQSPAKICAGQVAELVCDAEDVETPNDLLAYEWDMGDGQGLWNSESSSIRDWAWYEPGTYNVTCTVWDGGAKQTTASISVVVAGEATDSSCPPYDKTESAVQFCPREPPTPAPTPTPTFRPCRAFCESSDEPWESKCSWGTCVGCTSCSSHTNSDTTTTTTTDDIMFQSSGKMNRNAMIFIVLLLALPRV